MLNASAAGSTAIGGAGVGNSVGSGVGKQFSLGLQRLGTTVSVGASAIMSDRRFRSYGPTWVMAD